MVVFGAATIYGLIAESRCALAKKKFQQARAQPTPVTPPRPGFPASVLGLSFGSSPTEAERACASIQRRWHLEGAVATCAAQSGATAYPHARLEFLFNAVSAITVTFGPPAHSFLRDYGSLESGLVDLYGKPQIGRAELSAECRVSLAECLTRGERPRGAVWHWPAGSIELAPTQRGETAVIELRYLREDPSTLDR